MSAIGPLAAWLQIPIPQRQPYPDAVSIDWDAGTVAERVTLLNNLRTSDPMAAIERIKSTWTVDKADQRKDFLRTLERGLSPRDEPFLESVLDDKSVVVRRAAADLLARIPGSALLQRVAATIRECITVVSKGMLLNRKKALEVRLLSDLPAALARDGVEKKGAPQGTGEKTWWTMQGIALLPPSFWCEWLGTSPDQVLETAANNEDAGTLTTAWANAAVRHADAVWARSLLLAENPPQVLVKELFQLLAPADREAAALSMKTQAPLFIGLCQHPWSLSFTRTVVSQAGEWPAHMMRDLGRFASVDYLDEIAVDAPPSLLEFAAVLRFRREMLHAIQSRL
jgi:hypothetical protein